MKLFKMGLLGKKVGMTKIFKEDGVVPVSVVLVGPCVVLKKRTAKTDEYSAIQLGFEDKKEKKASKADRGNFKAAKATPKKFLKEIRLKEEDAAKFEVGQEIKVSDVFKAGDFVDVIGTSIGKGFQGVVKRHHMVGNTATRGTHEYRRHVGSIGCRFPQHVIKGKRFPGHMGNKRVTIQNLKVQDVKGEDNLLLIEGAVPGKNNYLVIKKAVKLK